MPLELLEHATTYGMDEIDGDALYALAWMANELRAQMGEIIETHLEFDNELLETRRKLEEVTNLKN